MRRLPGTTSAIALCLGAALAATGCGGNGGGTGTAPTAGASETAQPVPASEGPATAAAAPEATPVPTEAPALVPGSVAYRVVNATGAPVDVHVRSQGLVRAEPAELGLEPGGVSSDLFPPDPGAVVILPAGEGDATCVSGCRFLAESSTTFGEGDLRVLVVRPDGASTELWANPEPASVGAIGNALAPADPTTGLVIIDAGGMADAAFGLNVSIEGVEGCVAETSGAGMLLGGTSVLAYPVPAAGGALAVYPASDKSCSGEAAGGPVTLGPAPSGSRTLLELWGPSGAVQSVAIPLQ
jgi:hypothetical protein